MSVDDDSAILRAPDLSPAPDDLAQRHERAVLVARALSTCPPQQRELLRRYYGIGCTQMTMRQIAREMQLTTQRLYQLKAQGLRQLRHSSARLLLDYAA